MDISPRDNLIDIIEFNFYQGRNDFDASIWNKYIDAIEEKLKSEKNKIIEQIEYALAQEDLSYGMPEDEAIKFRMRKVFSILKEIGANNE